MFIDVKKAHVNARFDEEEWVRQVRTIEEMAVRHEESHVGVGRRRIMKTDDGRVQKRQSSTHGFCSIPQRK